MAQSKETGVFQLENGNWGYRFALVIDGQRIAKRKSTDATGAKLKTKRDAIKAREAAIVWYVDGRYEYPPRIYCAIRWAMVISM